jgi:L-histidine N-alpha-methyltransferase
VTASGTEGHEPGPDDGDEAGPGVTVDVRLGPDHLHAALCHDARVGLSELPKWMPPVWFYDDRGSALYEQITRLPEYYPFRTEQELLQAVAGEVAERAGTRVLVELGSGTSEKTHLLLDAMRRGPAGLAGYVAFDVSEATLRAAAETVAAGLGIGVHAIVGDFHDHLDAVPDVGLPRLVAFLGSTIGNLDPAQRKGFLAGLGARLGPEDRFLLATDLVKPVDRLVAAYDDAAGVTAAFNRNLLHVLNRELGASFDPAGFDHVAVWDPAESWIEMRLRARTPMTVALPAVELEVDFAAGEEMRTEVSTKFTPEQVAHELAAAGLAVVASWTDPAGDYLLTLSRPL